MSYVVASLSVLGAYHYFSFFFFCSFFFLLRLLIIFEMLYICIPKYASLPLIYYKEKEMKIKNVDVDFKS